MLGFGKKKKQRNQKQVLIKAYSGADKGRLYGDWNSNGNDADTEIRDAIQLLRERARDLSRNNDYIRRFFNLSKVNIIGHAGVKLQVNITETNGKKDSLANNIIESGWKEYCKKGNTTTDGTMSMIDLKKIITEAVFRDGEILIRKHKGWKYNNHMFALQPIEADQLDHNFNGTLPNGNTVTMGVEKDTYSRPVNYWLLDKHPGNVTRTGPIRRIPVPADEIIHLFIHERVGQTRGVTWIASPMARCKMLDAYEETELVASRVGASTMGFIVSPDGDSYPEDDGGEKTFEAEPGLFRELAEGQDVKGWDPNHPNSAFKDFEKTILRGIASGLNVSYVSLANDLEGVSYSSIRQGEIADRDHWRVLQTWFIEHFCQPVFEAWLEMFLSSGVSILPMRKYNKFNSTKWQPRGWQWVDPEKESKAAERDIRNHIRSIVDVAAEKGLDFEENVKDNATAKEITEENGMPLFIFEEESKNEAITETTN